MSIFGNPRYDYQKTLMKYAHTLGLPMPDLTRLCRLSSYLLIKAMKLESVAILVLDQKAHNYLVRAGEGGAHGLEGISLPEDNPLFQTLLEQKKELLLEDEKNEAVALEMRKLKGELFISVISKHEHFGQPTLLGVVCLGKLLSGDSFSQKDINFLHSLLDEGRARIDEAFLGENDK
ncbi:MAG: hypothetical protein ABIH69_07575 [bacterium]